MSQLPFVSIVLPAHNEALNIRPIYKALVKILLKENLAGYEIIFVDDGSTDDTASVVEKLYSEDKCVKLVQLFRNFGHQCALTAGMTNARGDVVVTMDADLQHPPETIREMLARYREGNDVVYTIRQGQQDGFLKNTTSRLFYALFRRVTGLSLNNNSSDFRLMGRQVVDVLNKMEEKDRFLRGMTPWIGGRYAVVEYKLNPRLHGQTSYSFQKSLRLAITGMLSFSTLPLKAIFYLGILLCALSFAYGLYLVGHKVFVGTAVPGYTDIIASVLFLGGVQLVSLGIIGKFVSIVLDEVRRRPNYIVRRTIGIDKQQDG